MSLWSDVVIRKLLHVKWSNLKITRYLAGDTKIGFSKFHENRLRIDCEIGEKHALQVNVTSNSIFFFLEKCTKIKI